MVKVTDKNYYMDGYLKTELDFLKTCVANKWDGVIVFDGVEGSGKTNMAKGCMYYLDNTFNLDRCVFTPEQFNEAVDKAERGDAILWDEFSLGGLSTDANTSVQSTILKKLTTIRKKGLYIGLVISWVFELRKYFAIGRTRFLIHTTTPDGNERGYFRYYNFDKKRTLYLVGKKFYEYKVKANFFGRFTNLDDLFWDEKLYDVKKEEAIKYLSEKQGGAKAESKTKNQRDKLLLTLFDNGYTTNDLATITGLSSRTVQRSVSEDRRQELKELKT